jgi:hypothetical protein
MLLCGLCAVQLFVALTVISAALAGFIQASSPGWQCFLVEALNHLLLDNLWLSFVVPLILWVTWVAWLWSAPPLRRFSESAGGAKRWSGSGLERSKAAPPRHRTP